MIVNTKQRWSGVKKHAMRAVKTQTPIVLRGAPMYVSKHSVDRECESTMVCHEHDADCRASGDEPAVLNVTVQHEHGSGSIRLSIAENDGSVAYCYLSRQGARVIGEALLEYADHSAKTHERQRRKQIQKTLEEYEAVCSKPC